MQAASVTITSTSPDQWLPSDKRATATSFCEVARRIRVDTLAAGLRGLSPKLATSCCGLRSLNTAIAASLKSPDVIQRLGALGYEPIGGSPEQFTATIKSDIGIYARIVKTAGIKADL